MSRSTEPLQLLVVGDAFDAGASEGFSVDTRVRDGHSRGKRLPSTAHSLAKAASDEFPDKEHSALLASLVSAYPGVELVADADGTVLYANAAAKVRLADGEALVGQKLQFPSRSELGGSVSFSGPLGVRKCAVATTRVRWPAPSSEDVATQPAPSSPSSSAAPQSEPLLRANVEREETVLLVDDDPAVRRATGRVLRGLGYRVIEAANGEEACRELDEHAGVVSVVVTDMLMPGMTGLELFDFVHGRFPALPFLVVTGESQEPELQRALRLLHKPFHPKELASTLRAVLDG